MSGAAGYLAILVLGLDFGYEMAPDGKLVYILQIPLRQYETLRESPTGLESAIPPEVVRHVQRIRIVVGSNTLPRDLPESLLNAPQENLERVPFNNSGLNNSGINGAGQGFSATNPPQRNVNLAANNQFQNDNFSGFNQNTPRESSVYSPDENANNSLTIPRDGISRPGPSNEPFSDPIDQVRDALIPPIMPNPSANLGPLPEPTFGMGVPRGPAAIRKEPTIPPSGYNGAMVPGYNYATQGNPGMFANPNLNTPSYNDTMRFNDNSRFNDNTRVSMNSGLPNYSNTVERKDWDFSSIMMLILFLCFSIGLNIYLGWLTWEYYLRYRESFETWRQPQRNG
jgi:hypothetical protein